MKIAKRIGVIFLVYIGVIVAFESLLGYFQPANQKTLVITTYEENGAANPRVLARLESNGQLYVAANHWPRAWYNQALANPDVHVVLGGESDEKGAYRAVPVTDKESERVDRDNSLGIAFRILTGFPPRLFVRLDPR